jgi:phosphopantetheinyl transferase
VTSSTFVVGDSLCGGSVHIWQADLNLDLVVEPHGPGPSVTSVCVPGLMIRAFRRAVVHAVLARYLGQWPCASWIERAPGRKPVLVGPVQRSGIHFSVSSTQEIAVVAVARHPVGVDIEEIRSSEDLNAVAALAGLRTSDETVNAIEFTRRWTRLEALAKCDGAGLPATIERQDAIALARSRRATGRVAGSRVTLATFSLRVDRLITLAVRAPTCSVQIQTLWPGQFSVERELADLRS